MTEEADINLKLAQIWGVLGLPLSHSLGKLCYNLGNSVAKNTHNNNKTSKDLSVLKLALKPASHFSALHFRYQRIEI